MTVSPDGAVTNGVSTFFLCENAEFSYLLEKLVSCEVHYES